MSERFDGTDEKALRALREGEQSLNVLVQLVGLNYYTTKQRLNKLIKYQYIGKPAYGFYALTNKGRRRIEESSIVVDQSLRNPTLSKLIDLLPTELHRCFFRLLITGIIAKYLYFQDYEVGYPSFIIGGATKAFKTALAGVVARLFGFKESGHTILVPSLAPGELWGRRYKTKGADFDISQSPHFAKPWICFDEVDKVTNQEVKRGIFMFLDGRREFEVEGKVIKNHAITMVTLNTKAEEGIERLAMPDAYIRRSVVVDTEAARLELGDVDLVAERIFSKEGDFPRLDLQRFKTTQAKLQGKEFELIRRLLMSNVKPEAENLVDTKPLELLTLGRVSLLDNNDIKEAIYQTLWDRLTCLESINKALSGWRERVGKEWIQHKKEEQPELERQAQLAEQKRRQEEAELRERQKEAEKWKAEQESQQLNLQYDKQVLIKEAKEAVQKYKNNHPELAKPLQNLWHEVNQKATSWESLERYSQVFRKFQQEKVIPIERQKEEERQRVEAMKEIHSLKKSLERTKGRWVQLGEDTTRIEEDLKKVSEIGEREKTGNRSLSDALTRLFIERRATQWEEESLVELKQKEEAEKAERRDKNTRRAKLKQHLKELEYYLNRRQVRKGDDPVLTLQDLGIVRTSDGEVARGSWHCPPLSDHWEYHAPIESLIDFTGKHHGWYAEVSGWTSWQDIYPLLKAKRDQLEEELANLE